MKTKEARPLTSRVGCVSGLPLAGLAPPPQEVCQVIEDYVEIKSKHNSGYEPKHLHRKKGNRHYDERLRISMTLLSYQCDFTIV